MRKVAKIGLAVAGLALAARVLVAAPALGDDAAVKAELAEMRKSLTLGGKPVPPEIFRDMGDGDLADSGAIWVSVDVKAAIGSNLYYDDIIKNGAWVTQRNPKRTSPVDEQEAYKYIGSTENGLLVAVAAYSGGGSGDFFYLHVLDLAATRGFDLDGKLYRRLTLTNSAQLAPRRPLGRRGSYREEHDSASSPPAAAPPTTAASVGRRRSRRHGRDRAGRRATARSDRESKR